MIFFKHVKSLTLSSLSNRRASGLPEPPVWVSAVCLQLGVSVGDHDLPDARPGTHPVSAGQTSHRSQEGIAVVARRRVPTLATSVGAFGQSLHAVFSGEKGVSPLQVETRQAKRHVSQRRQNSWGERRHLFAQGGMGVRTVFSRRFQGTVKTVTVRRVPSGKYFVSVLVEDENQVSDPVPETLDNAVGGNLGLHEFLVLSTGEKYPHPQWLERELYRLKILQRRLAVYFGES